MLVTAEDLEALRDAAEADGQSMSSFMRDAGLRAAKHRKRQQAGSKAVMAVQVRGSSVAF